jgi:hypothetical protein
MRRSIAIMLLLAACRGQSKEPATETPGSGSAAGSAVAEGSGSAAADPWVTKDAPPATPEEKKKRAEAALLRVADIQVKLAKLRGLPMPNPVPAAFQSPEDFRKFVQSELEKELPKEKATKLQEALLHVGLYTKAIDLPKVLEQTMTSQAAAYYDPASKKFYIVMAPDNDTMLDTISAHVLTHALQDHHFDLAKFMPPTLDDDAGIARRFVVEGDATFSMIAYLATDSKGPDALSMMIKLVGSQIESMANMSVSDYAEMMKQQAASMTGMDAEMKKSMESIGELPPVIVGPMIDSYMKGAVVSMRAFDAGGWKAIDALYKKPPTSTEQVLHPSTKLIGKREEPKLVTLPKLPGDELTQNVMGELQWQIYLGQWNVKQLDATAGWGGDRYAVMKDKDGRITGYLATTWDTEKDAKEFAAGYIESLKARFPGADVSTPEAGVARTDKGKVFVRQTGHHVFIVDGADDAQALDTLAKGTKVK